MTSLSTQKFIAKSWTGLIREYSDYINISKNTIPVSLLEGNTPLVKAPAIEKATGIKNISVYLKLEGANPSGSFKDRGMTVAISKALDSGFDTMVCASTGNTSASVAAYCACARSLGLNANCVVLIPDGYVALGKLAQAIAYGAKIIQVSGNFDEALKIVIELSENSKNIALVNSVNPDRIEGQKTASFEICDQLGESPDFLAIPVGNAGNITAYWKGFKEYKNKNLINKTPKMLGFQAEGASPIVKGYPIENPETIATAIRIGNPASWKQAEQASQESNGSIQSVTDQEIIEAYKLIHAGQGITCEPASAASVAGLLKTSKINKNSIPEGSKVVCVLTGHGLKDPDTAIKTAEFKPIKTEANINSVLKALS